MPDTSGFMEDDTFDARESWSCGMGHLKLRMMGIYGAREHRDSKENAFAMQKDGRFEIRSIGDLRRFHLRCRKITDLR